ncbi:cytochrome b5-like [Andrographis paniculata]|uniref:cytochrome b5-like n=1 Tax=Andrographis paniculata TaxID=175694 RepID=UPI0021E9141A|nr:cytochrome b5-like [Andrographis paniculata]
MGAENKLFSYLQVSSHNTSEDCWVIINGKVYNVTNYLNEHPGGDEVILGQAGKDASEEFEDVGHGSAARLMLDEFYVGEVDPTTKMSVDDISVRLDPIKDGKEKLGSKNNKLVYILLVLAIIGFGLGVQLFVSPT